MKKTLLRFIVCAGIVAMVVTACKKETHDPLSCSKKDSTSSSEAMRESRISSKVKIEEIFLAGENYKEWAYTKEVVNGQVVPIPGCDMDNIPTFFTNGTYVEYDGPTSCDSVNTGVAGTGTWSFTSDGKYINFNDTDLVGTLLILKLTPDTLGIQFNDAELGGAIQLWLHAKHSKKLPK